MRSGLSGADRKNLSWALSARGAGRRILEAKGWCCMQQKRPVDMDAVITRLELGRHVLQKQQNPAPAT